MVDRSRVASVTVALLLVLSAVSVGFAPSPVGTAEAAQADCSLYDLLGLNGVDTGADCWALDKQVDDNSTAVDHYQQAESINSTLDGYLTTQENYGNGTQSLLWSEAKFTVVEGLNDGNTSAVVKSEANETIRDKTTARQQNMVQQWNAKVAQMQYLWEQNNTVLERNYGLPNQENITGFVSAEIDLQNGTTAEVTSPVYYASGSTEYLMVSPFGYRAGSEQPYSNVTKVAGTVDTGNVAGWSTNDVAYVGPTKDLPTLNPVLQVSHFNDVYSDSYTKAVTLTQEVDAYVDGIYTEFQEGELSLNETLSPVELASRAGADYNDTGYFGFAAAELASLGYSSDLNSSFTVEHTVDNTTTTLNGTLFYTADDLEQIDNGTTYDLSALNGTFFMAVQDGNQSRIVTIESGTLTVTSLVNAKTGDPIQNATFKTYVSGSYDSSKLQSELDRLAELREFYEDQAANDGTPINFGTEDKALIGVLAVALILVLTRD